MATLARLVVLESRLGLGLGLGLGLDGSGLGLGLGYWWTCYKSDFGHFQLKTDID